MNNPKCGLRLASIVLALLSLSHLWRLIAQPEVLVAGALVPLWISALAFIVLGGLAFWLWTLSEVAQQADEVGETEIEPD
ncbi:hypothetical protein [Microbulbifer yueqingensis]|uniref:Uncharacterized protein n=1 Tax=Microbulbifer yueqingensis TaxID=658219 RepID=A0A1G8WV06_9GAMM|nr:hypothetical protein [Microbulbifer yueqingensis]SDJ81887.1 hypothetical protein SAMN05216212_0859 [Microbulbifer yueqingensis]